MAFNVGDVVKRKTATQKMEVVEVLENAEYKTKYYPRPPYSETVVMKYKEDELELVE